MNIHDENKVVLLSNGNSIIVEARDYPWIQEWNWHFDTETLQAVRFSEGEKVFLYHELLRIHQAENMLVALQKESLKKLFDKDGKYSKVEKMWARRAQFGESLGLKFPPLSEVVSRGLSIMILLYYQWLDAGRAYRLNGEEVIEVPMPQTKYRTFKEWLLTEYTGDWIEDEDLEVAESYDLAILDALGETMFDLLQSENEEGIDVEAVFVAFEDRKLGLATPILRIRSLLEEYLIPTQ